MNSHQSRRVGIAEFKARLSAHLRRVRQGDVLTVYDRDTPIARVVPLDVPDGALRIRAPRTRPAQVVLPPPLGRPIDSLAALLEERQGER